MHLIGHMRRTPYESPAAPMSNNATDPVELNVFAAPNQKFRAKLIQTPLLLPYLIPQLVSAHEWSGVWTGPKKSYEKN